LIKKNTRDKQRNWRELQDALAKPASVAFDRFCEAEAEAQNEDAVNRESLPTIFGEKRRDHPSAGNVPFGNMDGMAPDVFKRAKPDLYWGARPEQIDRRVRQDLNKQITPSTNDSYPAAPTFFLEVKDPDGSAAKKMMQACYAGAIGARGMHALQGYGQAEPTYDNRAYTFSSMYHDGTLKLYVHHPTQPSRLGESPQDHMTPLRGFLLTDSPQTCRQGVGAFRNARDLAMFRTKRQKKEQTRPSTPYSKCHSLRLHTLIDSKKIKIKIKTPHSMRQEPSSIRGEPRSMLQDIRSRDVKDTTALHRSLSSLLNTR
jgi:hypothetical protein